MRFTNAFSCFAEIQEMQVPACGNPAENHKKGKGKMTGVQLSQRSVGKTARHCL